MESKSETAIMSDLVERTWWENELEDFWGNDGHSAPTLEHRRAAKTALAELSRLTRENEALRDATEPFKRTLGVIDALPDGERPMDEYGIRDWLPRSWPSVSDFRRLAAAAKEG